MSPHLVDKRFMKIDPLWAFLGNKLDADESYVMTSSDYDFSILRGIMMLADSRFFKLGNVEW